MISVKNRVVNTYPIRKVIDYTNSPERIYHIAKNFKKNYSIQNTEHSWWFSNTAVDNVWGIVEQNVSRPLIFKSAEDVANERKQIKKIKIRNAIIWHTITITIFIVGVYLMIKGK